MAAAVQRDLGRYRPGQDPRPDPSIHYRNAYLYPNGDLLAIYEAAGDTPWGYGLYKMDKDSRLIWKYWRARITIWMSPPTATSMF